MGHGGGSVTGIVDGEARPVQVAGDDIGDGGGVVRDEYAFHATESRTGFRPSAGAAVDVSDP